MALTSRDVAPGCGLDKTVREAPVDEEGIAAACAGAHHAALASGPIRASAASRVASLLAKQNRTRWRTPPLA